MGSNLYRFPRYFISGWGRSHVTMKLQDMLNSRAGIAIGLGLSRLPTRIGYAAASWLASRVASFKHNPMVQAVRANQWVVHDEKPTSRELDKLVRETYHSTARSLYEFWHYIQDDQAVKNMVRLDPSFTNCFKQSAEESRGLLMVVPHMSNFDIIGRAVVLYGYKLHILSYPQPPGGYRWQNVLRELPGLKVTPMSIDALRQASDTLRSGGAVLTGVDRPLQDTDRKYQVQFFGRPATLPVFHIRLALKHDLPVVVLGGCRNADCTYTLWASDPIPLKRHSDLVEETVQNAESILTVMADYIRRAPSQWAMFYPVWPDALEKMPV